jgi:hypothetical protein
MASAASLLLVLFVAIQCADIVTTAIAISRGAEEANLLPVFLFTRFGFWPSAVVVKVIAVALAAVATEWVDRPYWFTGTLCLMGVAVLANNIREIGKQR